MSLCFVFKEVDDKLRIVQIAKIVESKKIRNYRYACYS